MQGKYFRLYTGYTSQCYWAQESKLDHVPIDVFRDGMRGFKGVIPMTITKGGRPCDFLGNSAALHVASERVIRLFEEHDITGYDTYDVEVSGGKVELPRYYGLIATGRGGHILPKESGAKFSGERDPAARTIMALKCIVFDENQWDGSDIFYLDEDRGGGIIVTEKVRDLFKKEKVRNCELTPLEEAGFGLIE